MLSAPGPDQTVFPNPLEIAYSGGTASFNGPAGNVQRRTQSLSYFGDFAPGDPLFFTGFTSSGPLGLLFSSDVTEVGTQFGSNSYGSFTASISAFDAGNNLIGSYTANGVNIGAADNSAVFLGIRNTAGNPAIRRVLFGTTNDEFGFSINQVSFGNNPTTAPVPEPSTYAMFGLGLVALIALQRRKRKSSSSSEPAFNSAAC